MGIDPAAIGIGVIDMMSLGEAFVGYIVLTITLGGAGLASALGVLTAIELFPILDSKWELAINTFGLLFSLVSCAACTALFATLVLGGAIDPEGILHDIMSLK